MRTVTVKNKSERRKFIMFRHEIYGKGSPFVDNDIFMIRELFRGKTSFTDEKFVEAVYVEDNGSILCEGMIVYSEKLSEYIQLCFFVCRENCGEAAEMIIGAAKKRGKEFGCKRIIAGLNGHVNYGLGFLMSDYDKKNSFSSAFNPEYYHGYFKDYEKHFLSTYKIDRISDRLDKYGAFLRKIEKNYTFRYFDKKQFSYYSEIYTVLNNKTFINHRYYYGRTNREDEEMLRELFLFMNEDSLIFAFDGDKPIGFIMWYPDFNQLAKGGEAFGAKHFIKNLFMKKRLHTAKVMEYGVLSEYRAEGLPLALIHKVAETIKENYPDIIKAETSWVMDENEDSAGFCRAVCDGVNKKYVVYEKEI